jgi:hypothetical protein
MASNTRTVWVNVYRGDHPLDCCDEVVWGRVFLTEAVADACGHMDRIGGRAWPLEIKEQCDD